MYDPNPLPGLEPRFLRYVGRHKANDWSFGLLQCRRDIPQGSFGYVGQYWCEDCGGFDEELCWHTTHRQTWEQPEEGYNYCPHCGSNEVGESDQFGHHFKLTKRYRRPNMERSRLEAMRREIGYTSREDYEAEQEALPPHKRDGYAERMADRADMLLDRFKEHGR